MTEERGDQQGGGPGRGGLEFHLYLPQLRMSLPDMAARARAAEEAGFAGMAMMDHLAPPAAADHPMYEALTAAMYLACRTERLVLGHLVLCDAFRHPAVLARQAVTIDHASGGRFEVGMGSGSVPAELATFGFGAEVAGAPRERVERLGESLAILRGLWSGEPFSFAGRHFTLERARQLPVPTRRIPIVVGGTGPRTMALVRQHAEWWNVPTHQGDRIEAARSLAGEARLSLQVLVTFVADEGRRAEVEQLAERRYGWMANATRAAGNGAELVNQFRALAGSGVERVYTWFTDFAPPETLAAFGEQVISALSAAPGPTSASASAPAPAASG